MTARTANCPNCGAEIVFRWSGAVQTTCEACKSVLVRHDVKLERVGTVGDVPPSMSRIQLGTEGRFKGESFVVVGRIVYRYGRGHWSEWHLRMANDQSAWLSDAQGEYVFTRQVNVDDDLSFLRSKPGSTVKLGRTTATVTTVTKAQYSGVEGELPFEYWDKTEVSSIDVKFGTDGFGTIDFSERPPLVFLGEYESFEELKLTNLREDSAESGPRVKASSLSCPHCGAAIELRTGDLAQSIACPACATLMDINDANVAVIVRVQERMLAHPIIPLGTVGSLRGANWQVVGFQVRAIMVDGIEYRWREYLLWNADQGFRYLTEYNGHWNDVGNVRGMPSAVAGAGHPTYEYAGTQFKHFQKATAITRFVLGEFPWEVRVGDAVQTDDYVSPPLMLSKEATDDEITWSIGTYTDPERIRQAFKLKDPLRKPTGVFANQPNPLTGLGRSYFRTFGILALVIAVLFFARRATARNEVAFADSFRAAQPRRDTLSSAFVTRLFDVRGRSSNVQINIETTLDNDWAFFDLALLSEDGTHGYELGRNVSYYHGVDSDGSWSEGSAHDRAMLANVPPGKYYLRVEVERDVVGRPFNYEVLVRRDVPRTWPFLVAIVLLAIPPIFAFIREKNFESVRWAESDYAPEEDDEDE